MLGSGSSAVFWSSRSTSSRVSITIECRHALGIGLFLCLVWQSEKYVSKSSADLFYEALRLVACYVT